MPDRQSRRLYTSGRESKSNHGVRYLLSDRVARSFGKGDVTVKVSVPLVNERRLSMVGESYSITVDGVTTF